MRLGGTVCFEGMEDFEEKLKVSRFRAITAPFTCETPREEVERYLSILRRLDVKIAEVGVWRNPFDSKQGKDNLEYAVRQLKLADELDIPCCVNIVGTESSAGWDAADPETIRKKCTGKSFPPFGKSSIRPGRKRRITVLNRCPG